MVKKMSTRKAKYVQCALDNGGVYTYDLQNEEDLAQATESLGGMAHLKIHAPAVHAAFLNSKLDSIEENDEFTHYYANIISLDQQSEGKFVTETIGLNCDALPAINIETTLYDYFTNVQIASDGGLVTENNEDSLLIDASGAIKKDGNYKILNASTVLFQTRDEQFVVKQLAKVVWSHANPATAVKQINVDDPRHPRDTTKPMDLDVPTTVLYNRDAAGDYSYSDTSWDQNLPIELPVNGSLELADGWQFTTYSAQFCGIMEFAASQSGIAYNNQDPTAVKISINNDTNILSWEVNEDWHGKIIQNAPGTPQADADILLTIYATVKNRFYMQPQNLTIRMDSHSGVIDGGNIKKINKVRYFWGCFGQDTEIQMADNSVKKISDIVIGDTIATLKGTTKVTIISHGHQEKMYQVGCDNGSLILLTSSHPVLTNHGTTTVSELKVGDVLKARVGETTINQLKVVDYRGQVTYHLTTGSPEWLIANDLLCGNDDLQLSLPTKPSPVKSKPAFSKDVLAVQKQLVELLEKKGH